MLVEEEWRGQRPNRFTTNRSHFPDIKFSTDPAFNQIYNSLGKKTTYNKFPTKESQFKPSVKQVAQPDRPQKQAGKKIIEGIISFVSIDILSFNDSLVEICNDD